MSPLGDGSAGDSGGGDRESPLIEEIRIVEGRSREIIHSEEMFPDESIGRSSVGEGEAEEVIEETSGGGVDDIGEHYVHGVFGADGSGAEHGESELHSEDEVSGEEEVGVVDGVSRVGEFPGDCVESPADEFGGGFCGGGVGST